MRVFAKAPRQSHGMTRPNHCCELSFNGNIVTSAVFVFVRHPRSLIGAVVERTETYRRSEVHTRFKDINDKLKLQVLANEQCKCIMSGCRSSINFAIFISVKVKPYSLDT